MQEQPAIENASTENESIEKASLPYIGQWNDLVSTTNWDKGRIICNWRDALIADGAPAAEYSDDAWARCVGGVSGQHVGRLRRVYQRFGETQRDYPSVYWSHFQAALDWNDAEMWLEGVVQNNWSVSQLRNARWEALGAPEDLKPQDSDIVVAELDEDVNPLLDGSTGDAEGSEPLTTTTSEVRDAEADDSDAEDDSKDAPFDTTQEGVASSTDALVEKQTPVRPFEKLPQLPEDLTEALESFKLAIVSHKLTGWEDVAQEDVLAALDALKALAVAPSEE